MRQRLGQIGYTGAVLALLGIPVGFAGFFFAASVDRARTATELEAALSARASSIETELAKAASAVRATEVLLRVTPGLTAESFGAAAAELRRDLTCISALQWAPRVLASERGAHESEVRRTGASQYEIRERLPSGETVRAADRPVLFPVRFVEPAGAARWDLGLDLGADPVRAAALERAERTGEPTLSEPVRPGSGQEAGAFPSLLLAVPVLAGSPSPPLSPRDLSGFAVGVVRIEALVRRPLAALRPAGRESLDLEIVDEGGDGRQVVVSSDSSRAHAGGTRGAFLERTVTFGGRRWSLRGRSTGASPTGPWASPALGAGVGSFLVFELLLLAGLSLRGSARERALADETELIRSVIRSMPDGVVVADATGRFVVVNDAARRMGGGEASHTAPADWSSAFGLYVPGTDRLFPVDELPLARALRGEEIAETEVVIRTPRMAGDTWVGASASPLRDGTGRLLGGVSIFRDLTERKRASELAERLSSAVEQTADSVFITNIRGEIQYVNPAFERTTGYSRAEAIGKTPRLLRSGEQPAEFYAQVWSTILGGETFRGTVTNRKRSGELFVAEQTITPMRDSRTGEVTHFVSLLRDLTDRLRLAEHAVEQRIAGSVQQRLFPLVPPDLPGLDIAGVFAPAQETFGDYFDFIPLADGRLMFVVADVCGHGMGAALIMVETRAYLRSLAMTGTPIHEIVVELNRLLLEDLEAPRFVTMVLGTLDPGTGALEWANMGHPKGVLIEATGEVRATLDSTCRPLGLFGAMSCPLGEPVTLQPGESLLVVTDGVLEAAAPDGTEFGFGGTLAAVRANLDASAKTVIRQVVAAAMEHASGQRLEDDATVLLIRRAPAAAGAGAEPLATAS